MARLELDFSGQVILVTGATRGIGRRIAQDFSDLGGEVIGTGTGLVDFSYPDSTEKFLESIRGKKVDVLVNNAAWNHNNLIDQALVNDFERIMDVDLKAPWLLMKTLGPGMKERGYGRIVNIASILGVISIPGRSAYTTAKSGLIGMTKSTALDLAPEVLVNCVSPGFVDTEMTRKNLTSDQITTLSDQIPMRRFAITGDISSAVVFLASRLNTYICGQNLVVDGGYVNI